MILDNELLTRKEALVKLQKNKFVSNEVVESDFSSSEYSPWFVRFLIGAGAWMSSGLFLIFLFAIKVLNEKGSLPFGIVFIVAGIAISILPKKNDFLSQLSLALNFGGHICLVIGLISYHISFWKLLMILVFLEIFLLIIYKDILQKFLSVFSIPILLALILKDFKVESYIHILVLLIGMMIVLFYEKEELFLSKKFLIDFDKPVRFGLIFSLFGLLSFCSIFSNKFIIVPHWFISGIGLTLCTIYFSFKRIIEYDFFKLNSSDYILAGFFALIIGGVSIFAPGIPFAILMLLISFSRKDSFLFASSILFFIAFLSGYYYNLDQTLLVKSIALMGSGLAMLLLKFFLTTKIFSKEKDI